MARYIDDNPEKTLVECRRDLKCGGPALQTAYVLTRRRLTRLYGA